MTELGDHIEALRQDPASDDAANVVRSRARERGALREYAEAFVERGLTLVERKMTDEAIDSLVEAALVYEEDLEDLEAAAGLYEKVLDIEAGHRRALFALGLLFHDLGRWDDLIRLYRRRLAQSSDDGERTTLHLYIAELLSDKLHDASAAFVEVTTAARLAPRNLRIVSRLEKLGEKTGRIGEVAVVIGDLILHQEDPRVRAALSLRLAELHLGPLNDPQRALAYLRAALADDGGNPEILSEVEDVFRERARFDDLAVILEDAAKDRRVGPHRVRLERELSRIYELDLGDKKRALIAMTRAAKDAPGDREILDEVMRLGLVTAEMEIVAETYELVCRSTDNALLRTYMRLKLGHIYAGTLGRIDDAIRVYGEILEDDPTHKEAQRRLLGLVERRKIRDQLDEPDRAVEAYRSEPEPVPAGVEARAALADIERSEEDRPAPRDAVSSGSEAEDGEPRSTSDAEGAGARPDTERDLAGRVGVSAVETRADEAPTEFDGKDFGPETETAFDREVTPPRAAPSFDPVVSDVREPTRETSPSSSPAPAPAFARVLPPPPPPPDPADVALAGAEDVVSTFEVPVSPLASRSSEAEERLVGLEQELQQAVREGDKARSVRLLGEVIRVQEALGRDERAFFAAVRLAEIDPTVERLEETIRLGRRSQGYPLLFDTVGALAQSLGVEAEVKLGLMLAEIELDELRRPSDAVARLSALSARVPQDASVFERWTRALERDGRLEELVDVLKERALTIADPGEAIALIRRAAFVRDTELDDPRSAAEVLVAFLRRAPERDDIREEAAALLEKAAAWSDLVSLLEAGLERLEGGDRADMRLRIAKIDLERLGDAGAAERTLRRGIEERARDPALLALLESVYEKTEDFEGLVDVLHRRLDVLSGARARNVVRRRLAEIAEHRLYNVDRALDVLADAIRDDPGDLEALAEIERLRRAREDWDGVLEVLTLKCRTLAEPMSRAEVLIAIAQIEGDVHGNLEAAASTLREALANAPENCRAIDALASIEERRGDVSAAIDLLRRLASRLDVPGQARTFVRIGRLYERALDDVGAAREEYRAAHDADPNCLDAILALLRIRELEGDYITAQDLASRAAALTEDERDKAALWRRAAEITKERVGDEARALELYELAIGLDPEDLATTAKLGELCFARHEFGRAYPHLLKAADGLSDIERTALLFSMAGQAAEHLGKHEEAIACYESALKRAPKALVPMNQLSALLEHSRDWARAYDLCAAIILHHEGALSVAERGRVYLRMARAKKETGDLVASARLGKKASLTAETLADSLALLADVLADSDPFEAAECLKRMSQLTKPPIEKRNALSRASEILVGRGQDLARGAAMLAEAQAFVPEDIEIAERLASLRERLGDSRGVSAALAVPARLLAGRARADLLVRAAKASGGSGRDRPQARRLLTEALEIVPTHQEALPDLALMLEFDGEWMELTALLERAAAAFLEDPSTARDAPDLDRKVAARRLLEDLLRLYRLKVHDPERGLAVVRRLLELDPDGPAYREEFARLLDTVADRRPETSESLMRESIAVWSRLVEEEPGFTEGLRRLRTLRLRVGEPLLARIPDEILAVLNEREAELPPPANGETAESKAPSVRQKVDVPPHALERSPVDALFLGLGYAPIRAYYESLPEPKPKRRDLVGAAGLGIHVTRPLEYACAALGVAVPPVFVRDDAPCAVVPALVADEPALIVSLALAEKHSSDELRFLMGRALSLLRPRALSLATVPLDLLRDGIAGFAKPPVDLDLLSFDPKTAKKRGKTLERTVPQQDRARLAEVAHRWLTQPDRRTLADERAAVLRTAERVGLVTAGSLLVSIGVLKRLSDGRIERAWHLPLLEYAATRSYTDLVRRLSSS